MTSRRLRGRLVRYNSARTDEQNGRSVARHLYGAIVVLAVLITADDHEASPYAAAVVLSVTVAVLLGMESFADVIAREITLQRSLTRGERADAIRDLVAVTGAAEAPLLFLVLAGLDLMSTETAFTLAEGATIALLFFYGYRARRLAGRRPRHAALTGMAVAGIGLALAFGKGYVHF